MSSPIAGSVRVSTAAFPDTASLQPPFALIARINNHDPGAQSFSVVVDGAPVCRRSVPAEAMQRIDCAVVGAWDPTPNHEVRVDGPLRGWTLDYLELATHHGNTTGLMETFVLPAPSDHYAHPALGWVIVTWLILLGITLSPVPRPWPTRARWVYGAVATVIVALFVIIQLSAWISDYRLVLSVGTFIRWLVLLEAPRLYVAIGWFVRRETPSESSGARLSRVALVPLVVLSVYAAMALARIDGSYGGNYSGLLHISRQVFDDNPLLNERDDVRRSLVLVDGAGYDGQFMYFATFDPLLRAYRRSPATYRRFIDAPPYRFGRIGFSLLTRVVSVGHWAWVPGIMAWLILGALSVVALLLALLARQAGLPPAMGALVLVVPGFWQSVQTGLPEPIAAATLVAGVSCLANRRWVLTALFFALSLLVRETGLIAIGCLLVGAAISGRRREALAVGVGAVGVLALWRLYVAWVLFPDWGLNGLLFHPPDLAWPFVGFVDLWRQVVHGQYYPGLPELSRAAIVFPLVLTAGLLLAAALVVIAPTAVTFAALSYGLLAVCLNLPAIWVHVGNGQRGTYELFLMLALSTLAIREYPQGLRRGVIWFWWAAAFYVFIVGLDATDIRAALPLFPI